MEINQYDITMASHDVITRNVYLEITLGNDITRGIHCDITMSNDIAMCTYHGITMHNDVAMNLFFMYFLLYA